MSERIKIEQAFQAISTQADRVDSLKAQQEYDALVREIEPDLDLMLGYGDADPESDLQMRIKRARAAKVIETHGEVLEYKENSKPAYRGSGIVVVANRAGFLVVSHEFDSDGRDIVAEKYPDANMYGLLQVGRAALLSRLNINRTQMVPKMQELLDEAGWDRPDPHHLGYDYSVAGPELLVGTSGILPSEELHTGMRHFFSDFLADAKEQGWVEWPHDEFAGYHDLTIARYVIDGRVGSDLNLWDVVEKGGNPH